MLSLPSRQSATATTQAVAATAASASTPANSAAPGTTGIFGNRSLEGTIISAGPTYLAYPTFRWGKLLVRMAVLAGLFFILGTVAIMLAMTVFLLALLISCLLGSSRSRGTFFQDVAAQFVGSYLASRLLGKKQPIPVTDYRLRDSSGLEHLVRLEGYVMTGAMNVGDDVRVEGTDRSGTLILKRGWNKRLRTAIKIKRP